VNGGGKSWFYSCLRHQGHLSFGWQLFVLSADIIPREKKASGVRLRKGMIEETLNRDPFKKRDQEWINLNN
jgi:hypothetical protein